MEKTAGLFAALSLNLNFDLMAVDRHDTAPVKGDAILKRKREEGVPLRWSTPPSLLFARCAIRRSYDVT